jgi:SAM-dependent methyltransferase
MDTRAVARLNALNRAFYAAVADAFDTTRGRPWPGWRRLLPLVAALPAAPLRLLDAGCGNGRFGVFVASELGGPLAYSGIDSHAGLLARAGATLAAFPAVEARLECRDLLDDGLPDGRYDLVVLFGVLHHVPGAVNRRRLVQALAGRLAPGGLLAFTCWRFLDYPRHRERIAPWPDGLAAEPGDALLEWRRGTRALRYCHHVDDAELAALIAATGLTPVDRFRSDGQERDANLYTILRAETSS